MPGKCDGNKVECRTQIQASSKEAPIGIDTIVSYAKESDAEAVETWKKQRHSTKTTGDHIGDICRKSDVFEFAYRRPDLLETILV